MTGCGLKFSAAPTQMGVYIYIYKNEAPALEIVLATFERRPSRKDVFLKGWEPFFFSVFLDEGSPRGPVPPAIS